MDIDYLTKRAFKITRPYQGYFWTPEDLEDCIQEMLVTAWECEENFDGRGELSCYQNKYMKYKMFVFLTRINRYRMRNQTRLMEELDTLEEERELLELPDFSFSKSREKRQFVELLHHSIKKMDKRYRDVFRLKMRGKYFREIGEYLGLSREMVRLDFYESLSFLKTNLKDFNWSLG